MKKRRNICLAKKKTQKQSSFSAAKDKTNLSCARKSRFLSLGASDCSCWRCGPRARTVKCSTKITSFGEKNLPGSAIGSEVCFPLIRGTLQLHYMQEHCYLEPGYQRARRALWYSINITASNPARVWVGGEPPRCPTRRSEGAGEVFKWSVICQPVTETKWALADKDNDCQRGKCHVGFSELLQIFRPCSRKCKKYLETERSYTISMNVLITR